MLARHAASASKQAARASQEACFVASRRASTTASCRSSLTRPEFHSAPAPGRSFRPSRRSYHSRWAISVYGKEPGAPKKEYEGYEKEMVAFKRKGLAFEDAMVNDDPLLGPSSDAAPSATEKQTSVSDHLGNIEKRWDEEEDDEEEDEEEDFAFEKDGDDEDDDWLHGDGVDVAKAETNENLGLSVAEGTPTDPESLPAGLYLVGTPIGNLEDITLRALRVLRSADAILCEDTRHTRRLLDRYGVARKRLISYHCHNERRKRDGLVEKIKAGFSLALVSDAGTPSVADPGADLCAACADVCLPIFPIPGPCAPASAIVAAGAITPGEDGFSFIGFLPPKTGARRRRWQKFANAPGSLVAFVPPHKLVGVLEDAVLELGEARKCVVCREMTKVRAAPMTRFVFVFFFFCFLVFWFFQIFFF